MLFKAPAVCVCMCMWHCRRCCAIVSVSSLLAFSLKALFVLKDPRKTEKKRVKREKKAAQKAKKAEKKRLRKEKKAEKARQVEKKKMSKHASVMVAKIAPVVAKEAKLSKNLEDIRKESLAQYVWDNLAAEKVALIAIETLWSKSYNGENVLIPEEFTFVNGTERITQISDFFDDVSVMVEMAKKRPASSSSSTGSGAAAAPSEPAVAPVGIEVPWKKKKKQGGREGGLSKRRIEMQSGRHGRQGLAGCWVR